MSTTRHIRIQRPTSAKHVLAAQREAVGARRAANGFGDDESEDDAAGARGGVHFSKAGAGGGARRGNHAAAAASLSAAGVAAAAAEEAATPASPDAPEPDTPVKKAVEAKPRIVDLSNSRHAVVKRAARAVEWEIFDHKKELHLMHEMPNVIWTDTSVSVERVSKLSSMGALVNHFPMMDAICRKVPLAMNLSKVQKRLPLEYAGIIPRTFLTFHDFRMYKKQMVQDSLKPTGGRGAKAAPPPKPYFIVKPNSGCMGKGIYLTSNPAPEAFHDAVVQEYLPNPLLIEGRKFDLRCYVLVLSVCPPRIFFYQNGLIRICAEPFVPIDDANAKAKYMHLSNYAVNKTHAGFTVGDGQTGGKRDFPFLSKWLGDHGHDAAAFWGRVHDLAAKTVLAVVPTLAQAYRTSTAQTRGDTGFTCFEILGFDILVNDKLEPVLCEVNHSPSWVTDTPFDATLKLAVISEAMRLATLPKPTCLLHPHHKQDKSDAALAMSLGLHGVKPKALAKRDRQETAIKGDAGFLRVYPAECAEKQREYKHILADGVALLIDGVGGGGPAAGPRRVSNDIHASTTTTSGANAAATRTGGYSKGGGDAAEKPTAAAARRSFTTPAGVAGTRPRVGKAVPAAAASPTARSPVADARAKAVKKNAAATAVTSPTAGITHRGAGGYTTSGGGRGDATKIVDPTATTDPDAPPVKRAGSGRRAVSPMRQPAATTAARRSVSQQVVSRGDEKSAAAAAAASPQQASPAPTSAPPPRSVPVKRVRGGSPVPVPAAAGESVSTAVAVAPAAAAPRGAAGPGGFRRTAAAPGGRTTTTATAGGGREHATGASPVSSPGSGLDPVDVEFARLFNKGRPVDGGGGGTASAPARRASTSNRPSRRANADHAPGGAGGVVGRRGHASTAHAMGVLASAYGLGPESDGDADDDAMHPVVGTAALPSRATLAQSETILRFPLRSHSSKRRGSGSGGGGDTSTTPAMPAVAPPRRPPPQSLVMAAKVYGAALPGRKRGSPAETPCLDYLRENVEGGMRM